MRKNSNYFKTPNYILNTNSLSVFSTRHSFVFYNIILAIIFFIVLSVHNTSHGSTGENTYTWDNAITIPTLLSPQS